MGRGAFDPRFSPWWVIIAFLALVMGIMLVKELSASICVDPPSPEFNDPCHPDLIIFERKQSNGNTVEQRYWTRGQVAIHDGQVFFLMKERELWLSLPVDRVQIKYDLGACLACE